MSAPGTYYSNWIYPFVPLQLYELPIIATDGGGRSGFATLKVHVGDENDNAPMFQHREYKSVIYSNSSPEVQFLRLQATDSDENQNAAIRYSIYDAQNAGVLDLFRIDERTGWMALRKSPKKWGKWKYQQGQGIIFFCPVIKDKYHCHNAIHLQGVKIHSNYEAGRESVH